MQFLLPALIAGLAMTATASNAADQITLQLQWVTQAQFAGYYVAKDKGFYKQNDLEVIIKPGGASINTEQVLAEGRADVIVYWLTLALVAREKGVPLVNISQTFQGSSFSLTCLKSSGISSPADFRGHTIGVWHFGHEYIFLDWMAKLGIPTDGGPNGVTVVNQRSIDLLINRQAACISTLTYNEYWQVIDAGFRPDDLVVFKYADEGLGTLEDGLYASGERLLNEPGFIAKLARFVAASNRGWAWATKNQDDAVRIVLANDATHVQTEKHQKRMMHDVARLIEDSKNPVGYLDPTDYERTVSILLSAKTSPVIAKIPDGAWTHAIYQASKAYSTSER
jgi:NitT/TauT family transport system substrate-binding protein